MYEQISANKRKTVFLIFLFVLLLFAVGAAFNFFLRGGWVGLIIIAVIVIVSSWISYFNSDKVALAMSHAVPADPVQYARYHNIVEGLCIASGLPKPRLFIVDDPAPNAFSTGRNPKHAAVAVTTGLLEKMNRVELEGVLAHELSHIRNYDVRLVLIVATVVALAGLLASIFWRGLFFTRVGNDREGGGAAILILIAAAAVLSVIAVIVGPLMQFALSRSRESLADATSVEITRNPAGLLHALEKLQKNDKPFAKMTHVTAAMCIDDPLQHHNAWFHHLFDTHPPIEQRIAALQRILSAQET